MTGLSDQEGARQALARLTPRVHRFGVNKARCAEGVNG
jgi:hypothetical protein